MPKFQSRVRKKLMVTTLKKIWFTLKVNWLKKWKVKTG